MSAAGPAASRRVPARSGPALIKAHDARLMLLGAQGLLDDPGRMVNTDALAVLIEQMGFVQIDTINVLERAHHLTLLSRLEHYQPAMLAHLLEQTRDLFEHWTHDASVIPTKWFGHWRHRFKRYKSQIRAHAWWRERMGKNPKRVVAHVRKRIATDGPLQSRDFEHDGPRGGEANGWWGWKPQKAALEYLWRCGELAVARRVNFQKVYDLSERVLPRHCDRPASDQREHVDWACRTALERLGFATASEIAAFWSAVDLPAARRWCRTMAKAGEIVEVTIESSDGSEPRAAFAFPDWRSRLDRLPSVPRQIRLLSPFDPVVRDRKRAARLFDFQYTFEAFVPAPKRQYGYYVMPILEGERLIGRLDPKLHRARKLLEIKGLWWEPGLKVTAKRRAGLDHAIERLAAFVGAATVVMP